MLSDLRLSLALSETTVRRPEELAARGTFTNSGAETMRFNTRPVSAPALALSLRRAGGAPVPLPPPPVPSPDDGVSGRVDLAAGESHAVTYENFLPQPLAPGEYELALRYRIGDVDLRSAWVWFKCE